MKKITSIIFYLFVIFSCIAGAFWAHNIAFEKEIIFIAYVATVTYAIFEIIFMKISFLKNKIVLLRMVFIVACSAASFVLLRTPEEMILKNELKCPVESFKKVDVKIKPWTGYLVYMKLEMSYEQFSNLINKLGYKKIPFEEVEFYDTETKNIQKILRKNGDTILSFVKDDRLYNYGPRDIKYLVYDTEIMMAYYEHLNDKGWD